MVQAKVFIHGKLYIDMYLCLCVYIYMYVYQYITCRFEIAVGSQPAWADLDLKDSKKKYSDDGELS